MKTVAIFIEGYLPAKKYGGPVTSLANIVDNLGEEYRICIISNNHDLDETEVLPGIQSGWNKVGNAQVVYLYAQMGLSILISFAYTPIMLKILGQAEYGI